MLSCYILNGVPVWLDTGNITTLFFEGVMDVDRYNFSVECTLRMYMVVNGTRISISQISGISKSNLDELPATLESLLQPCKKIIINAIPHEDPSGIIHKYIEDVVVPGVKGVILK